MFTAETKPTHASPPVARRIPKITSIHGNTLVDDYFWLRERANPDVIAYLETENAYTDFMMRGTGAFQESLYKEMLSRIQETDVRVPYLRDGYYYYSRTEKGKQYPIYCRKKGDLESDEEILLDLNEIGKGHDYTAIGAYSVSDDGKSLAYSVDFTGYRVYNFQLKSLETGKMLPDDLGNVRQVFWANDNLTLFYSIEDDAKRSHRIYRHKLGDPKEKDVLVYEEKDKLFSAFGYRARSKKYVFFGSASFTSTEFYYIPADQPASTPLMLFPRQTKVEYYPDHHGNRFFLRINDTGKNFRLVSMPVSNLKKENWCEEIPVRGDVSLEDFDLFQDYYVTSEKENGLDRFRITDFATKKFHYIDFPEPAYSASLTNNVEFDSGKIRYNYQSLVTPESIFDYDMRTGMQELKKQAEVLGGYDPVQYQSERIYATASDGTRIPISMVYRRDLKKDGIRPMLLYAYGSYSEASSPSFNSNRLSLLDRGIIYAIAHIRGGGEMGEEWHDQGKMMNKKNTFTDFISSAEYLISEKYTSSDRLVITGGSAGGLLMGAVINMRPDLFKAVVTVVPFVDVINTMLDESLPLTVGEFEEWGNPKEKAAYEYIKSYSPYDNIAAMAYPDILVKTSLNDSQVPYWEPVKYVAKMRTLKTDQNLLLLKINMGSGHGGASGRYDKLKETAFDYSFILSEIGAANK